MLHTTINNRIYNTEMSTFWKIGSFMHSVLGWDSFCRNYCISVVIAWRRSACCTCDVSGKPQLLWKLPSAHLYCWSGVCHRFLWGLSHGELASQSSRATRLHQLQLSNFNSMIVFKTGSVQGLCMQRALLAPQTLHFSNIETCLTLSHLGFSVKAMWHLTINIYVKKNQHSCFLFFS